MGKRSRNRPAPLAPPAKKPETFVDRFIAAGEQRPKAPWHPVPLVELCVLAGIILIVVGFIDFEDRDGRILLALAHAAAGGRPRRAGLGGPLLRARPVAGGRGRGAGRVRRRPAGVRAA